MTEFKLSPAEIEQLHQFSVRTLPDSGVIHRWTPGLVDENNLTVVTWVPDADPIAMGFKTVSPREVVSFGEIKQLRGMVRLPRTTTINTRDRLLLTTRYGQPLNPPIWLEIVGLPVHGPAGLVASVAEVTSEESPIS